MLRRRQRAVQVRGRGELLRAGRVLVLVLLLVLVVVVLVVTLEPGRG